MLADCLSFLAGRFFRSQLPRLPVIRLVLSPSRIQKAETLYHNHGLKGLLAARFMPGFRTPLFFTAGTAGVPFMKFFLTDMLAATVSVSLLIFLGWYFPMKLQRIQDISELYKWAAMLLIAGGAGVICAIRIWRKKRKTPEAAINGTQ
jgi:membrane protein DedA with SNARE-associated domain